MSQLRIIAGCHGGRMIRAVGGESTRPTTERVREAWASTVSSLLPEGFSGVRVLDAFAGSGALGLEALSRGASQVIFCERDSRALATLRANRDLLDEEHAATTILAVDIFTPKAFKLLTASGPYDLILLDPPYACAAGKIKTFLHGLAVIGALGAGALVVYEHSAKGNEGLDKTALCSACSPASLRMVSCKTYGMIRMEYLLCQ